GGGIEVCEPNSSSFCQNSNESNTEQLLWKDNNKHACCVTPKQQVDLQRWTLFLTTDSPSSDPAACANGNSPDGLVDSQNETSITVLLEAAFREDTDRNVQDYHILVEQLAIPYAWKAREKFGIIVYTNPAKLLAMIQAFFNNALIIDDDFIIKKILTIDVSGVPSTLDDPLSIPECVTPRPYSNASQKRAMTAMELARCLSPAPPSRSITPSPLPPQVTHDFESPGSENTETSEKNKHHAPSTQSSQYLPDLSSSLESIEGDVGDRLDFNSDSEAELPNLHSFYPHGWIQESENQCTIISGQPLPLSSCAPYIEQQPLSTNRLIEDVERAKSGNSEDSSHIVSNPLNEEIWPSTEHSHVIFRNNERKDSAASNLSSKYNSPNHWCRTGGVLISSGQMQDSSTLAGYCTTPCDIPYSYCRSSDLTKVKTFQTRANLREIVQEASICYENAIKEAKIRKRTTSVEGFHQRALKIRNKPNIDGGWIVRSSSATALNISNFNIPTHQMPIDFSFSPRDFKSQIVTREPIKQSPLRTSSETDLSKKSPLRINSEAHLTKATSIIKDNLANIIQNYLIKTAVTAAANKRQKAIQEKSKPSTAKLSAKQISNVLTENKFTNNINTHEIVSSNLNKDVNQSYEVDSISDQENYIQAVNIFDKYASNINSIKESNKDTALKNSTFLDPNISGYKYLLSQKANDIQSNKHFTLKITNILLQADDSVIQNATDIVQESLDRAIHFVKEISKLPMGYIGTDNVDINIINAKSIVQETLNKAVDIVKEKSVNVKPPNAHSHNQLLTTKNVESQEFVIDIDESQTAMQKPLNEPYGVVPMHMCSRKITQDDFKTEYKVLTEPANPDNLYRPEGLINDGSVEMDLVFEVYSPPPDFSVGHNNVMNQFEHKSLQMNLDHLQDVSNVMSNKVQYQITNEKTCQKSLDMVNDNVSDKENSKLNVNQKSIEIVSNDNQSNNEQISKMLNENVTHQLTDIDCPPFPLNLDAILEGRLLDRQYIQDIGDEQNSFGDICIPPFSLLGQTYMGDTIDETELLDVCDSSADVEISVNETSNFGHSYMEIQGSCSLSPRESPHSLMRVESMTLSSKNLQSSADYSASSMCDSGLDMLVTHEESPNNTIQRNLATETGLLMNITSSPVDFTPESGFSSLQDPIKSVEDHALREINPYINLNKSRESLDLTDRGPGTNTFSDEIETLSSNIGDMTHSGAGLMSSNGSSHGSISGLSGISESNILDNEISKLYTFENTESVLESVGVTNSLSDSPIPHLSTIDIIEPCATTKEDFVLPNDLYNQNVTKQYENMQKSSSLQEIKDAAVALKEKAQNMAKTDEIIKKVAAKSTEISKYKSGVSASELVRKSKNITYVIAESTEINRDSHEQICELKNEMKRETSLSKSLSDEGDTSEKYISESMSSSDTLMSQISMTENTIIMADQEETDECDQQTESCKDATDELSESFQNDLDDLNHKEFLNEINEEIQNETLKDNVFEEKTNENASQFENTCDSVLPNESLPHPIADKSENVCTASFPGDCEDKLNVIENRFSKNLKECAGAIEVEEMKMSSEKCYPKFTVCQHKTESASSLVQSKCSSRNSVSNLSDDVFFNPGEENVEDTDMGMSGQMSPLMAAMFNQNPFTLALQAAQTNKEKTKLKEENNSDWKLSSLTDVPEALTPIVVTPMAITPELESSNIFDALTQQNDESSSFFSDGNFTPLILDPSTTPEPFKDPCVDVEKFIGMKKSSNSCLTKDFDLDMFSTKNLVSPEVIEKNANAKEFEINILHSVLDKNDSESASQNIETISTSISKEEENHDILYIDMTDKRRNANSCSRNKNDSSTLNEIKSNCGVFKGTDTENKNERSICSSVIENSEESHKEFQYQEQQTLTANNGVDLSKECVTTAGDQICDTGKEELKNAPIMSDIDNYNNEVNVSKDNMSGSQKSSSGILGTRALQNIIKDKKAKSSDSILEGAGISAEILTVSPRSFSSESSSSKSYLDPDVHSINHLTSNNSLESIQSEPRSRGHTLSSMGGKSEENSSKGSFDSASLKSQGSLDIFPHFDALTLQPKPKTPKRNKESRKKKLSVDIEPHPTPVIKSKEIMQRSATLPTCNLSQTKKYDKLKEEKSAKKKRKEKDGNVSSEKKSAMSSLKDFLGLGKGNKEKDKDSSTEKLSSPFLFRKLERKSQSNQSPILNERSSPKHKNADLNKGKISSNIDKTSMNSNAENLPISNGKNNSNPNISSPIKISSSCMEDALSSPVNCSQSATSLIEIDNENHENLSSPFIKSSPRLRKTPINNQNQASPTHLYRQVLTRHLSSSQESVDNLHLSNQTSPQSSPHASPKRIVARAIHPSDSSYSLPGLSSRNSSVQANPLMGTRALNRVSPIHSNSFSVTIGFQPTVETKYNRTMSEGENLNHVSQVGSLRGSPIHKQHKNASPPAIAIPHLANKRSSSMEILVFGKIRERCPDPERGGKRRSRSREGSFRLHREISVETLFELPEGTKSNEEYQQYLDKVYSKNDSFRESSCSLFEEDCLNPITPDTTPDSCPYNSLPRNSRTSKKLSLPNHGGLYFSGMRGTEMASSNPNLHFTNSPFKRGIPTSNSFTNSPFRRPHSSAAEFSPTKRGFASSGPPSNTDDGCSTPMGLGPVKEEELTRRNCDSVTEKPPNILIYSSNKEDYFLVIKETLSRCINEDRYIMYQLTDEMAFKSPWSGNTTLLVVCGDVPVHLSTTFIRYLLDGGRVLSICSDFLNVAVPLFGKQL
ncbi:unnamed protein product, partial [Meganyctiphanes norvegica]